MFDPSFDPKVYLYVELPKVSSKERCIEIQLDTRLVVSICTSSFDDGIKFHEVRRIEADFNHPVTSHVFDYNLWIHLPFFHQVNFWSLVSSRVSVHSNSGIPTPQQQKGDGGDREAKKRLRKVPPDAVLPDNQMGMSDFENTLADTTPPPPARRLRSKSSQVFVEDTQQEQSGDTQQKDDKHKDSKRKDGKQHKDDKQRKDDKHDEKPGKDDKKKDDKHDKRNKDDKKKTDKSGKQQSAPEPAKQKATAAKTKPQPTRKGREDATASAPPAGKKGDKPAAVADAADVDKTGEKALMNTLQRADTKEVEDQVAKRKAYKARKQRFYNSLTSVGLKTW